MARAYMVCLFMLAGAAHSAFASLCMPVSMLIEGGQTVFIYRVDQGYRTLYPNGNELRALARYNQETKELETFYILREPEKPPHYFDAPIEIFLALHAYYHKHAEQPELT